MYSLLLTGSTFRQFASDLTQWLTCSFCLCVSVWVGGWGYQEFILTWYTAPPPDCLLATGTLSRLSSSVLASNQGFWCRPITTCGGGRTVNTRPWCSRQCVCPRSAGICWHAPSIPGVLGSAGMFHTGKLTHGLFLQRKSTFAVSKLKLLNILQHSVRNKNYFFHVYGKSMKNVQNCTHM